MERIYLFCFALCLMTQTLMSQDALPIPIHLWPAEVPGETMPKAPPELSDDRSGDVRRLARVSDPVLLRFSPPEGQANGAAVIICPGGGYRILAIDKEGYEIAEWLSGLGYTALVLQYRVPGRRDGALQDLQRAIRWVREHAPEWNVEAGKVGVLGFSAGGHLAARASAWRGASSYPLTDEADAPSALPDATVLLYPAYLDEGPDGTLSPDLHLDADSPPHFLFVAADDPYAPSSLVMATALQEEGLPVEFHLVPHGGHGYGMRPGNPAAQTWPALAAAWLDRWLLSPRD